MNQPATQKPKTLALIKGALTTDSVKNRFNEILGGKSGQFMASIVNAVSSNNSLQKCDHQSIMSSAFVAASFDLPIDQNLGYAAIVPYGDKAQFQMMYKGFVQLAIRSGQYEDMNVSVIFEDELISYNPITGEAKFITVFNSDSQRQKGQGDKIIGYYAWFKLLNGFKKSVFMTKEEVEAHARQFSASYKSDLKYNTKKSYWMKDFHIMAKKTVLKLLLSKWGLLSVDMQRAQTEDQKVFDKNGESSYDDNKAQAEVIDLSSMSASSEGHTPVDAKIEGAEKPMTAEENAALDKQIADEGSEV